MTLWTGEVIAHGIKTSRRGNLYTWLRIHLPGEPDFRFAIAMHSPAGESWGARGVPHLIRGHTVRLRVDEDSSGPPMVREVWPVRGPARSSPDPWMQA